VLLSPILSDGTTPYVSGREWLSRTDGLSQTWYLYDMHGSLRMALDDTGAVGGHVSYDPWGVPDGPLFSPFGYTGELTDNGLVYLRARWYNPATGTFTSRDPFPGRLETPYSQHPYQYAYSAPMTWTDPSGRDPWAKDDRSRRRNAVNTERQWCENGVDMRPDDRVQDCLIAQDGKLWNDDLWARIWTTNDAEYKTLLNRSAPPTHTYNETDNPLCATNGMQYLCEPVCETDGAKKSCCGPTVDDWFAQEIRTHWDFVNRHAGITRATLGLGANMVFAEYAKNIPHKSYAFPVTGQCGTGHCQGTVTLCGKCIDRSELGNMMFGIMASQWGFSFSETLLGGWHRGGMDTTADEATIVIGYHAIRNQPSSGSNLCAQINQWKETWQAHAADPLTTTGCEPCTTIYPGGTRHTKPGYGNQLP
jgi:RHS repeat-associated protein